MISSYLLPPSPVPVFFIAMSLIMFGAVCFWITYLLHRILCPSPMKPVGLIETMFIVMFFLGSGWAVHKDLSEASHGQRIDIAIAASQGQRSAAGVLNSLAESGASSTKTLLSWQAKRAIRAAPVPITEIDTALSGKTDQPIGSGQKRLLLSILSPGDGTGTKLASVFSEDINQERQTILAPSAGS